MINEVLLVLLQVLSDIDISQAWEVGKFIISVVVGGVAYKYLKLYFDHQTESKKFKQQASNNLIENLEDRIKSLTNRVNGLEEEKEKTHQREIEVTKMLAKAEQKVETLTEKVEMLERNQKVLQNTVDKYYKKYGPLEKRPQN